MMSMMMTKTMMSMMMNTIAKRFPDKSELTKSVSENAALYGLTVMEYKQACEDWLQNGGYDESGRSYDMPHDWLTLPHGNGCS